jgi:CRISPR-associated endonuclease/helicase Cas3
VRSLTCEYLAGLAEKEKEKDRKELEQLLARHTLVVAAAFGGLDADGMLDDGVATAPRTIDDGMEWLKADENGAPPVRFRVRTARPREEDDENWRKAYAFLTRSPQGDEEEESLIVEQWRGDARLEDGRAIARFDQALKHHRKKAEQIARMIGVELGLPPAYVSALALAAYLHDEGKASWRWQRAFNAPRDGVIYAKTRGPLSTKLLDGYRHEFASLWKIREDAAFRELDPGMQDLVLHFVAAHHGFARPVISARNCEEAGREEMVCEAALRFARLQKRWGAWALAWLETLLRAADQQASRETDEHAGEMLDTGHGADAAEELV